MTSAEITCALVLTRFDLAPRHLNSICSLHVQLKFLDVGGAGAWYLIDLFRLD